MRSDEENGHVKWVGEKDANHFSIQRDALESDKITVAEKGDVYLICTALMLEQRWQMPLKPASWEDLTLLAHMVSIPREGSGYISFLLPCTEGRD